MKLFRVRISTLMIAIVVVALAVWVVVEHRRRARTLAWEAARMFKHVDGFMAKGEYLEIGADGSDRLDIRYCPTGDSGVELERQTNHRVIWRAYVQPLGIPYSVYNHQVQVSIEDDKIHIRSTGDQRISEVRSLETGELISRKITDVDR